MNIKAKQIATVSIPMQRELQLFRLRMPNTPAAIVSDDVTFMVHMRGKEVPYTAPRWGRDKSASFDLCIHYNFSLEITDTCVIVSGGLSDKPVSHSELVHRSNHDAVLSEAKDRAAIMAILECAIKAEQVMFMRDAAARAEYSAVAH